MHIHLSTSDLQATGTPVPDFPWIRFDTGPVCYNEALVEGRYLFAGASAMGRPMSRAQVHDRCRPPQEGHPWHPRAAWEPAFRLQVDGQLLADRWQWADAVERPCPRPGCREHAITLRHAVRPVEVRVCTRLDDTAFLVRWLEVTNTGRAPAAVAEAFTWSGRLWSVGHWLHAPAHTAAPFTLGRFQSGAWGREGEFGWQPLPAGILGLDSVHGRSGWGAPFLVLRNECTGENAIGHLAWSGNWAMDLLHDGDLHRGGPNRNAEAYLRAGVGGAPPLRVLEPGETALLPEFHLGFLFGDLDACVHALHEHLRRSVAPRPPEVAAHLVECNHTGYTQNAQITEECLFREVDVAADAGAELFVIDAGWYGDATRSWFEQVGDWEETPLLKQGLKPALDRIRARGMRCGLWLEAERMVPSSRTAQAHPAWFMRRRGRVIHHLDLADPAVARHVEETILRVVERYELDCFRLDYNFNCNEGADREVAGEGGRWVEGTMWRYYDALYGMFDRIRARHPRLLLENCAGGGGRTDLGMMGRFHWTQVTDNWSPQSTLKIVNGMTLALPPEQVMTLLGAISPGVADTDFMLRIGLFGHFCVSGIFPSPEEAHAGAAERWRHTIGLYKTFVRPFLGQCRIYHHTPCLDQAGAGGWCVLEMAAADASCALVGVWRLPEAAGDHWLLRPRGLDPARSYRLTSDNTGRTRVVEAGAAVDQGLAVQVRGTAMSELLLFRAV